jgi:ATP synthase protein I
MVVDDPSQDPGLPRDARLGSLDERLRRAEQQEALRNRKAQPDPSYRIGQQVLGHLIGAPFGGALIGWGLDSLLGTMPLFLLVLMFFGFGVGVRNVIRISKTPTGTPPGPKS